MCSLTDSRRKAEKAGDRIKIAKYDPDTVRHKCKGPCCKKREEGEELDA